MDHVIGIYGNGRRGRATFLVALIGLSVLVAIGVNLEWGRLAVDGRLVVADTGLALWQGVTVLVVTCIGAALAGLGTSARRTSRTGVMTLVTGVVVTAVAGQAVAHLVARPADIAAAVQAGADSIPLRGYVMPVIESTVGAGAWMTLTAGLLTGILGLAQILIPVWRARPGAR
ncbi:MAG: hypothetical protein EXQ74_01145 [Thermoleophilia bacterium]|nr:hypothetical protein [Thermoleophilia bacterium]